MRYLKFMVQYYHERVFDMKKHYNLKHIYLIEFAIIVTHILLGMAIMYNDDQLAIQRGRHLLYQKNTTSELTVKSDKHKLATKLVGRSSSNQEVDQECDKMFQN